jgi:hypothetical protein
MYAINMKKIIVFAGYITRQSAKDANYPNIPVDLVKMLLFLSWSFYSSF